MNTNSYSIILIIFFINLSIINCKKQESKNINKEEKPVVIEKILESSQSWDGKDIPSLNINDPKVTALRIRVKKGVKLPMHTHPVLNIGYILQGILTVHKENGEKVTLKQGDSLVEVINQWHYGENTGKDDVVIVVFYVGEKKQELTILKEKK